MADDPLVLRFGGALVEQLGAQLYPSATATVAELISNSWDADASNVWVTIPLGEDWNEASEILVVDDGHGMDREQAQESYLAVGRRRRQVSGSDRTPDGRPLHGRKGIGKLAAFGTAGLLECHTLREGATVVEFALDYDRIRSLPPGVDCEVAPVTASRTPTDPAGTPLDHGTLIRLSDLNLVRKINHDQFMQSMARRFAIDDGEMRVEINGEPLRRYDVTTEFRFPTREHRPSEDVQLDNGWGVEQLPQGEVRWWIGFTEKPLDQEFQTGVSVLAHRKMAQRPFKFGRSRGAQGQLGQEYLVGEVVADWLDDGTDSDDDVIQSNRDQLHTENPDVLGLLDWGQRRLNWALRTRDELRKQKRADEFTTSQRMKDALKGRSRREQTQILNVARTFSEAHEQVDQARVEDFVEDIVDAYEDAVVRTMIEEIDDLDDDGQAGRFLGLVQEFGLIDARRNQSLIEARLSTIDRLQSAVESGAREVPELHDLVQQETWLLDPRWALYDDEVDLEHDLGISYDPTVEAGLRMDFLFGLRPPAPAAQDELIVVEIKRAHLSGGATYKATDAHINNFHSYVVECEAHRGLSSQSPTVRGLFVAEAYTDRANRLRKSFERSKEMRLEFRTWSDLIRDTKALHEGWLHVNARRLPGSIES